MNIIKFNDFIKINENLHDTPEEYVRAALTRIKSKIEAMFNGQTNVADVDKFQDQVEKDKGQNLADMNLELQSCELSRYSKTLDNVKAIYQDDKYRYDLTISIDLKDAVPQDDTKDFSDDDIKKCLVTFKAYDQDDNFNLIGKISKTVDIKDVNQDLLTKLKIEMDDKYGGGEEEFGIETE